MKALEQTFFEVLGWRISSWAPFPNTEIKGHYPSNNGSFTAGAGLCLKERVPWLVPRPLEIGGEGGQGDAVLV